MPAAPDLSEDTLLSNLQATGVADAWEQVFEAQGKHDFLPDDVAECLAATVEYGDCAETTVNAIVRLHDGRFAYVEGGCDTTGWDCQSSAYYTLTQTLQDLYRNVGDETALSLFGVNRMRNEIDSKGRRRER